MSIWTQYAWFIFVFIAIATSQQNEDVEDGTAQSRDQTSSDSGLNSADVAAIVLGCLLLLLLSVAVVVCVLLKKGYIGVKPEEPIKLEGIPDFSTTPDSIQSHSFMAIKDAKIKKHRERETRMDPIIYMNDDIYHPPMSRPLPGNGVKVEYYPEKISVNKKGRKMKRSRSKSSYRTESHVGSRSTSRHSRRTRTPAAEIVSENRNVIFTTHYKPRMPYVDLRESVC